jgi:hypothetical protein
MNSKFLFKFMLFGLPIAASAQNTIPVFESKAYSIFNNKVIQGNYSATILSPSEISSNYKSPDADKYSPTVSFKFSINLRDNENVSGKDHLVTLLPENGTVETNVQFGKQLVSKSSVSEGVNLPKNTRWIVRLDMREVLASFKEKGFYTLFNGEKLYQADFKAVYIAGGSAPLMWDFNNLANRPELQLHDPDGDGIYETTLMMNVQSDEKKTDPAWRLSRDISAFPQYRSDYPVANALYNLAIEEMINAVEPDSTFRTGKNGQECGPAISVTVLSCRWHICSQKFQNTA